MTMKISKRILLCLINDTLLAFAALPVAYVVVYGWFPSPAMLDVPKVAEVLLFSTVVVFVSFLVEAYKLHHGWPVKKVAGRILASFSLSFIILLCFSRLAPGSIYGSWVLPSSLFVFCTLQFFSYSAYRACSRFESFANRIVILGTGPVARQIGKVIPFSYGNYVLSGYVSCSNEPVHVSGNNVLEAAAPLDEIVKREKASKLVVSLSEKRGVLPLQEIMNCKMSGIEVVDAASFYEQMTGKVMLENVTPGWFIFSEGFHLTTLYRILKRFMDVGFALLLGLLSLPLLPFIALCIRIDSRGPVFFRQVRVGENEENFVLYKFRTMREDAERGTGAVWAQEKDPRITKVGKFLRKTRIDELPQLYNVLKGDMSVVGPRPERPEFVEKLKKSIPYYSKRHFVKPGVTGWAQVRYRYGASQEDALEKLRYDLYYIKHLSPGFDFMIILATIKVVLRWAGR